MRFERSGFVLVFLLVAAVSIAGKSRVQQRELFYEAFSSGSAEQIDQALAAIKRGNGKLAIAYEGALLMRKAGLIKGAGEKLKMFKKGHELFENEIAKDPGNVELKFIRLCIQEKAPKILKYRKELDEDKAAVIRHFSTLPQEVQKQVLDYAASSEILTEQDLK